MMMTLEIPRTLAGRAEARSQPREERAGFNEKFTALMSLLREHHGTFYEVERVDVPVTTLHRHQRNELASCAIYERFTHGDEETELPFSD